MPISPINNNNINIPLIITSANIPTEDVARENAIRDKVPELKKLTKIAREKRVKKGDKDFQDTSWDPSQHPGYHHNNPLEEALHDLIDQHEDVIDAHSLYGIVRRLLSTSTYIKANKYSYKISYHFPNNIAKEIKHLAQLARTNAAIKHRYDLAVTPNAHSDLSITL